MIDELAFLTAYAADRDLGKRIYRALQLLLSQGRAPGVLVVAAIQDPRKETLPFRDLFTFRVAARLVEPGTVDLVLRKGAGDRGAQADTIPTTAPGTRSRHRPRARTGRSSPATTSRPTGWASPVEHASCSTAPARWHRDDGCYLPLPVVRAPERALRRALPQQGQAVPHSGSKICVF